MKLLADLKCYHCGQLVAQLLREGSPKTKRAWLLMGDGTSVPIAARSQVRCRRCGGPTYVDEVEQVHGRKTDYLSLVEAAGGTARKAKAQG